MNNRKYIDNFSGKVKSNRHTRFFKQKRKNIRLINIPRWPNVCCWSETYSEYILPDADRWNRECGRDYPTEKAYPKRYWRRRNGYWVRRSCNRRFRRQKRDFVGKSNSYRRCTEFWWELY